MAKTQTKRTTNQPTPVASVAVQQTDHDGEKVFPIRLWQEGDTRIDAQHHEPRAKEVLIDGTPYTHCGTDADGVWVYRNDRKN